MQLFSLFPLFSMANILRERGNDGHSIVEWGRKKKERQPMVVLFSLCYNVRQSIIYNFC